MTTREYLSVREAGEVLGVSASTIRRAIFEGMLPVVRVREGGTLRIPRSAVLWESRAAAGSGSREDEGHR